MDIGKFTLVRIWPLAGLQATLTSYRVRCLVIEYVFTLVVRFFHARNFHRRKNHARH